MNRIINILLVVVLVLVAVALLSSSAAAQPNTNANVNVTPDGSVYGSAYEISFNCKDESSSSFVVHNYTSEPLLNQEAYIEVDGQTLPVNRVEANGYTFVQPAVVEGEVNLYVGNTLVDSAVAGDGKCDPSQNDSIQYEDSSSNQYSSQPPQNPSSEPSGSNEVSQYGQNNGSPNPVAVLPDTSGASFYFLGAGLLLIAGGLIAYRLLR